MISSFLRAAGSFVIGLAEDSLSAPPPPTVEQLKASLEHERKSADKAKKAVSEARETLRQWQERGGNLGRIRWLEGVIKEQKKDLKGRQKAVAKSNARCAELEARIEELLQELANTSQAFAETRACVEVLEGRIQIKNELAGERNVKLNAAEAELAAYRSSVEAWAERVVTVSDSPLLTVREVYVGGVFVDGGIDPEPVEEKARVLRAALIALLPPSRTPTEEEEAKARTAELETALTTTKARVVELETRASDVSQRIGVAYDPTGSITIFRLEHVKARVEGLEAELAAHYSNAKAWTERIVTIEVLKPEIACWRRLLLCGLPASEAVDPGLAEDMARGLRLALLDSLPPIPRALTEEDVERAAIALRRSMDFLPWDRLSRENQKIWLRHARTVIATLGPIRPTEEST